MRLLNTRTLDFQEFPTHPPRYIILSHRWSDEEVSYADYVLTRRPIDQLPLYLQTEVSAIKQRHGYRKIMDFAAAARTTTIYTRLPTDFYETVPEQLSAEWCWVDTCCIDKSSSAELSEAINSMWAWYRRSSACFVYLADFVVTEDTTANEGMMAKSAWFKRSWTLQEFLAPWKLDFFDRDWEPILHVEKFPSTSRGFARWTLGKVDARQYLARLTQIPAVHIVKVVGGWLHRVPVANRMSWAANRSATRIEDVAYSLMGIFDVNMSLLYGEGHKAFIRLQHEILRSGYDDSIFAWWYQCRHRGPESCQGTGCCSTSSLLASHPGVFGYVHGRKPASAPRSIATMSNVEANVECLAFSSKRFANFVGQKTISEMETLVLIRLDFYRSDPPLPPYFPCLALVISNSLTKHGDQKEPKSVARRLAICNQNLFVTKGEKGVDLTADHLLVKNAMSSPSMLRIPIGLDRDHHLFPVMR